jgi:hypothetical protein
LENGELPEALELAMVNVAAAIAIPDVPLDSPSAPATAALIWV